MTQTSNAPHPLPCVVQLGFAGSRRLFEKPPADPKLRAELDLKVERHLMGCLAQLREKLDLHANHFLVGMSQIACGADMLFTRACLQAMPQPIPQRIVLPQHRAAYLSAAGSDGTLDFTEEEQAEAEALLKEQHIIQERVVSRSADRAAQFMETSVEILRVSDVIVCLLRHDSSTKPGGTNELLERAKKRGTPVLEICVGLQNGEPTFDERWHNLDAEHPFERPHLPPELAHESVRIAIEPLPTIAEFCEPLKKLVSTQAQGHQRLFRWAAGAIIVTHTLATICATVAVVYHKPGEHHEPFSLYHPGLIPPLLAVEVLLLLAGFWVHQHLHHSHAARLWAAARVVAELARSVRAIGPHHVYLAHLFRLPLPHRFRFLLRTLNVLHLRSTWPNRMADWKGTRDTYIHDRVDHQIAFYEKSLAKDERRSQWCQFFFTVYSLLAMAATVEKLAVSIWSPANEAWLAELGLLAIVLPVVAVGGLSWSAALDCEARVETFGETLRFLKRQRPLLEQAASVGEFDGLLLETETTLLGETANWFSRRSNTGVT